MPTGSPRFTLDKADLVKIGKAAAYSCASVLVGAGIAALGHVHLAASATPATVVAVAAVVSTVNAGLVALKNWLDDHTQA